ncbi:MAG: gfo/Idh/MocA family oxidoreductase, partial [Pedosphaera sp.]|nr:gfo/Idh/MocA family oxidoreductase [Pedosphaera sp.]
MTPRTFHINRRRFFKTAAAITAATGVPGWFLELEQARAAQPKPLGPNDRPGVALVGCGGQGRGDCGGAAAHADV